MTIPEDRKALTPPAEHKPVSWRQRMGIVTLNAPTGEDDVLWLLDYPGSDEEW